MAYKEVNMVQTMQTMQTIDENMITEIKWKNLNIKGLKGVTILNNLNGTINSKFCGILGESGSGKSMFLSSLSMRINNTMFNTSGEIFINDEKMSTKEIKQKTCYVMQNEEFYEKLSVYDTLFYSAELRMCNKISKDEKKIKIEEMITLLKLEKCRNTIVGNQGKGYGISYGEKKKLSIAVELLTDPLILFLDEPVSGLDSSNLFNIMNILKKISEKRMVICSIHQPQNNIYELFDTVMFMNNGEISYNGPTVNALAHYKSIGYDCDNVTNQSEHIINLLINNKQNINNSTITTTNNTNILEKDYGNTSSFFSYREIVPCYKQFFILFKRNMTLLKNDWHSVLLNIFITSDAIHPLILV